MRAFFAIFSTLSRVCFVAFGCLLTDRSPFLFFSIYDCKHNEVRPPHILRHGLEATNVKGVRILSTFETLENILLSYPFLVKIVFITIADIFHMTIVAYGP